MAKQTRISRWPARKKINKKYYNVKVARQTRKQANMTKSNLKNGGYNAQIKTSKKPRYAPGSSKKGKGSGYGRFAVYYRKK